jgi:hypothetical protein
MLKLLAKEVPPEGFRWTCPDCGYQIQHIDKNEWLFRAQQHVSSNHGEVPFELLDKMEDQLCQTLPPGWCLYDDEQRPRPSFALSWDDLKTGLSTFMNWFKSGQTTCDQAEAERRARICVNCYLNTHVQGCTMCHRLAAEILPDNHTPFDGSLRACAVCKCVLSKKIWFDLSVLKESSSPQHQKMYPSFCWMK